jgi:hypothetical protein
MLVPILAQLGNWRELTLLPQWLYAIISNRFAEIDVCFCGDSRRN